MYDITTPYLGMEPGKLQAEDQSHRPHRVPEHCDRLSRWIPLCFWRQGTHGPGVSYWVKDIILECIRQRGDNPRINVSEDHFLKMTDKAYYLKDYLLKLVF